jgi:hypothetical protein
VLYSFSEITEKSHPISGFQIQVSDLKFSFSNSGSDLEFRFSNPGSDLEFSISNPGLF